MSAFLKRPIGRILSSSFVIFFLVTYLYSAKCSLKIFLILKKLFEYYHSGKIGYPRYYFYLADSAILNLEFIYLNLFVTILLKKHKLSDINIVKRIVNILYIRFVNVFVLMNFFLFLAFLTFFLNSIFLQVFNSFK